MRARAYWLTVTAVVMLNICVAAQYVSHAPLVDGWAVWNRIMRLDLGQLSFPDYLLGFFGAHPHSGILLLSLLDHRFFNADQSLLTVLDYAAVAAFAFFCAHRFRAWARVNDASGGGELLGGMAIAALATTLADWEVMTLPFQGVLPVSRLAYVLLLWWLIRALRSGSVARLSTVTVLSCLAVTLHGTGLLFALVFLLIHLLRSRSVGRCLAGAAPLAVVLLHAYFYKTGGELDSFDAIVSTRGIAEAGKALLAYFATPLMLFRELVGDKALLLVGGGVLAFMTWLACRCLLGEVMGRMRKRPASLVDDQRLFAGALSLLVLLSSGAAAVLMTIRVGTNSYYPVLTSSRYVAYALIAYVLIACALARALGRTSRHRRLAMLFAGALGALGLYPSLALSDWYPVDIRLNRAIAALSVGIPPTTPPADGIWPGAKNDWYWVDALAATTGHLMKERAGPWSHLPAIGRIYVAPERLPQITVLDRSTCSPGCPDDVIQFSGVVSARTQGALSRSRTVPIVDAAGRVIGFAVQVRPQAVSRRRGLHGYLVGAGSAPIDPIFIGPTDGIYEDDVHHLTRSAQPQR